MAISKLTPLPPAPSQDDTEEVFVSRADASLTAQRGMVGELNQMLDALNPVLPNIETAGSNAARAEAAAQQAQTYAAAAGASAGIPALVGKKGKALVVAPDEKSVLFGDVGQKVGDILLTAGNPGSTYIQTGKIYQQKAYPDLFAKIGLLGDNFTTGPILTSGSSSFSIGSSLSNPIAEGKSGVRLYFKSNTVISIEATPKTKFTIPNSPGGSIASIDTDGNGVWLIGTTTGTLHRSLDNGETWSAGIVLTGSSNSNVLVRSNRNGSWLILVSTSGSSTASYSVLSDVTGTIAQPSYQFQQTAQINQVEVDLSLDFVAACFRSTNDATFIVIPASNPGSPVRFTPLIPSGSAAGSFAISDRYILMFSGGSGVAGEILYFPYTSKTANSPSRTNKTSVNPALTAISYSRASLYMGARIKDGVFVATAVLSQSSGNPVAATLISRDGGVNFDLLENIGTIYSSAKLIAFGQNSFDIAWETDGTNGRIRRYNASYSYDTATQFLTPTVQVGGAVLPYIKALENV
ncbi:hypothetical protein V6W80_10115 [Pseudomonas benzopyrenica]|uniref:Uncharacterized protein n=1 Tax=Pseudomonas benzopyrenica TaxID=2993566 RepID=A0ABZ2FY03_9PSED